MKPFDQRLKFLAAAALAIGAVAAPEITLADSADRALVDTDARWVLHLNLDAFRSSTVGQRLEAKSHGATVPGVSPGMRVKLDEAARLVHDVTAYGGGSAADAPKTGVLILRGDPRLGQIIEAILINEEMAHGDFEVETIQSEPYPLYRVKGDTYVAIHTPSLVVAGKSLPRLERAREILDGKRPGADPKAIPGGIRPPDDGFFFFGGADGFGGEALPARAAILRMAEQARMVAGESDESIHLIVELLTGDELVAQRLEKVIQGMIALFSLTAKGGVDFNELASRIVVETSGRLVKITFGFPADDFVDMLEQRRDAGEADAPADRAI